MLSIAAADTPVPSLIRAISEQPSTRPEQGYNPMSIIKGTKYEQLYANQFAGDVNPAQTRARMASIDEHTNNADMASRAGALPSLAAGVAAGFLDPFMYVPIVGGAAEGVGALSAAGRFAATGAVSTAASEAVMQATDPTRTAAESIGNIATGTVMMGLLGGALGQMSRGERATAEHGLDAMRQDLSPDLASARNAAMDRLDRAVDHADGREPDFKGQQADIYRTPEGALRVSRDTDVSRPVSDHVLQPIASDGRRVDLLPEIPQENFGGLTEASQLPREGIQGMLSGLLDDGHFVTDYIEKNFALHDGRVVVVDPGTVKPLSAYDGRTLEPEMYSRYGLDLRRVAEEAKQMPVPANDAGGAGLARSVGAAASDPRDMQLVPFLLKSEGARRLRQTLSEVPVLGKVLDGTQAAFMRFSPTLRVFSSGSLVAKRAMGDLAETALRFRQADRGVTTSRGVPLDRLVKMGRFGAKLKAHSIVSEAFSDYRFGDTAPKFAQTRAALADVRGQADGKLSYTDFKREVSIAMTDGDAHPIPQVQKAAQELRRRVFDPIKQLAQGTMGPDGRPMLGEDLEPPKGDKSFFPRAWNKEAIRAKRSQARGIITDWLAGEQATKAAAKDRIGDLQSRHEALGEQVDKLEGRLATLQRRSTETGTRLDERDMEAGAAGKRSDTLADRAGAVREALSEVDEFVSSMRDQVRDPDARARLDDLQKEANALRKEAAPMSAAELARIEREDRSQVLPGEMRKAAEVYLGKRRLPDPEGLLSHMIREGGVRDTNGDVRQAIGGNRSRPGLVRTRLDAKSLDEWGEAFQQIAPHAFPERPTTAEVVDIIDNAARGHEPAWWKDHVEDPHGETARVRSISHGFDELFRETGDEPKSLRDVVEALHREGGTTPAVLQRLQDKAAAARDVPGAEATVEGRRAALQQLRDLVNQGVKDRGSLGRKGVVASAVEHEAGVAERRSAGRQTLLQDRLDRQSAMRDLLEAARSNAEEQRAAVRKKMEAEIREWKGNSTADAVSALKARDEAERVRGLKQEAGVYEGKGERLTSADGPVDRAVKRIIKSDRDLSPGDLGSRADEIIDRINYGPDGRLPYEGPSHGGPAIPSDAQQVRGSLNAREFAIPTHLVRDFVHLDVEHVADAFTRTLLPDIRLTERFGDIEMSDVFRRLNEEYAARANAAGSEKEARAINRERDAMIRDLAATRDRIRGIYGVSADPGMRNAARIANVASNWNILTGLGTSVINRMSDMTNGLYRHAFMDVMRDGYAPYLKALTGDADFKAFPAVARQSLKDMGVAVDSLIGHMAHQYGDVLDNYGRGSKFERGLGVAVDKSMLLNLHGPWTDGMKQVGGQVAASELLRLSQRVADGTSAVKDIRKLAEAGIDPGTAERIWKSFTAEGGGQTFDKTHVPNTAAWKDRGARDAFSAAVARDADMTVVTPGSEQPLFMSKPVFKLIGQFKSFVAASYEKTLLANLQQADARTLQGLAGSLGIGMLSYRLYTWVAGQQVSDRPQDWIKEGIEHSGALGWLTELNNMQAKATGGKTDAFNLIGADRPVSRRQSEGAFDDMLGPTASKIKTMIDLTSDAFHGNWNAHDNHKLRQLVFLQNHFAIRAAVDQVEDGIAQRMGMKPMDRNEHSWPGGPNFQ